MHANLSLGRFVAACSLAWIATHVAAAEVETATNLPGSNPVYTSAYASVLENSPAPLPSVATAAASTTSATSSTTSSAPTCCNGSCGNCDCGKCCLCGRPGDIWVRDEYLGWWASPGQVPVLVTTSPDGTLPATDPLYGGQSYNGGYRSGNWVQGGMWFDCCHTHGIQADYFFIGQQSSPFSAASNGDPVLTRPFIDANTGEPAEQLIAFPGVVTGSVGIQNYNSLQGAGVSGICNLCCFEGCCSCRNRCWCDEDCSRLDFVYGFRFYNFDDNLSINEDLTSIDPTSGIPVGTRIQVQDSFATRSNFYGGELGLIYQRYRGRWMHEASARVALGGVNSVVWIDGSTVVSFPGQPTSVNEGGLLALSSNIGRHEHNSFTAIPQFSYRLGYRVTERLTLLAGYTLIYFGEVARAADQIDLVVNPNLIPPPIGGGPDRPAFNFNPSSLVLQGITLGAEYSF